MACPVSITIHMCDKTWLHITQLEWIRVLLVELEQGRLVREEVRHYCNA